jgi:hypothetical protein
MNQTPPSPRQIPSAPNITNIPSGQEKQNDFAQALARSTVVKQATTAIINSRADLITWLRSHNLDLVTSATKFQNTGDFIQSSYVVYAKNQMEPLQDFVSRNQALESAVQSINHQLKAQQSNMNVVSRR